jgi:hypothetical protein
VRRESHARFCESLGAQFSGATLLETLPIDLLNAHLNASFIFNHLDTMNGWSKLLLCNRAAQKKLVYNLFGLDHLRRYGTVCALPYPSIADMRVFSRKIDELGPDLAVEIADLLDCRDTRVILR